MLSNIYYRVRNVCALMYIDIFNLRLNERCLFIIHRIIVSFGVLQRHLGLCTERIEYKLLSLTYKVLTNSQLPNLHTFISSSPINVLAVLALHPSLLLLGQLHHHL